MKKFFTFVTLATSFLTHSVPGDACTGLKLQAQDGSIVHGRTFEFGIKVDTSIVVVPRNYPFITTTPLGKGFSYNAKYASIGSICFNELLIMDGMNEMGLSIGTFYFPGFAGYSPITTENQMRSLSSIDFSNWIITQFGTIEEVKNSLKKVNIAPTVIKGWGDTAPPFHYIVYDKSGNSIVIEPVNGQLHVYDNPTGVLTNSPNFEWHLTNLRNYINLTPKNVPPVRIDHLVLEPFGQGSGMVGLPGDFTPPSRFVRAFAFSTTAIPSKTADDAVFQTFHILNQFDIPVGIAREVANGLVHTDYTIATVVHDPNHLKYYFRTYDDQTIKMVNLNVFEKEANEAKSISTASNYTFVDVSNKLQTFSKNNILITH